MDETVTGLDKMSFFTWY